MAKNKVVSMSPARHSAADENGISNKILLSLSHKERYQGLSKIGKAAAITDALLPRSDVHFDFAVSGRAPIGQHHETFLEMPMELEIPKPVKEAIL